MSTALLIAVGLAPILLYWLFSWWDGIARRRSDTQALVARVRQDLEEREQARALAFQYEADDRLRAIGSFTPPAYEYRHLVSDFDLIAREIDPCLASQILVPKLVIPAYSDSSKHGFVRYYKPDDVQLAIDANIYVACQTWRDGVLDRFIATRRADKQKVHLEATQEAKARLEQFSEIKARVDAIRANREPPRR